MAKKSTRRGNNEGCISKRKDGNWVGVVTLGTDENGKRIRKSVYGKTKSEVTMKMLAVKADNPTIGCSAIKNETFRTLMQEWLMTFKRPSVSPRTFERCLSNARNTLYPVFGEMKIDEITAPMLQRLFNKMISDGYALATVKKSKFLSKPIPWQRPDLRRANARCRRRKNTRRFRPNCEKTLSRLWIQVRF